MRPLWLLLLSGCGAFDCAEWTGDDPSAPKSAPRNVAEDPVVEIPVDELEDRIRGGLLGQILGNLNGLPHEFKYIAEPGKVETYVPSLPKGAFTDDDTDIEWVYLIEMEKSGQLLVPPARIAQLWKENITTRIWCANLYARVLMDAGIEPPRTGGLALNPWAEFNISAQFVCEAFALISPAMPRTAARTGVHYTRVAVDAEPIQTTQLFTAMIATAFVEKDVETIVRAGLASVDPDSAVRPIVADVLDWWKAHPKDWRETRRRIKEKYTRHKGEMRDRNGYELNTAAVIGALLHGGTDDLAETLRLAFNFGWDADCNAAICGTIVGVIKGKKWMDAKGWKVLDVYKNTCRDHMPQDETITKYGDRLIAVARMNILASGGREVDSGGRKVYRLRREAPGVEERLPKPADRIDELRREIGPKLEGDLGGDETAKVRAVYLALCLGEAERLKAAKPAEWAAGVEALKKNTPLVRQIYDAPQPGGARLQAAARAEGVVRIERKP